MNMICDNQFFSSTAISTVICCESDILSQCTIEQKKGGIQLLKYTEKCNLSIAVQTSSLHIV